MSMNKNISLDVKDNLLQCLKSGLRQKMQLPQDSEIKTEPEIEIDKSGLRQKMQLPQDSEIKTEPEIEIDDDFARMIADDSQKEQTASESIKAPTLKKKRKGNDAAKPTMEIKKESRGSNTLATDENDLFGEFVAAEMRKIEDPFLRAQTKLFIHNLLFEARFSTSTTSTTPSYINQMFQETQTKLVECKPLISLHVSKDSAE